jgi:hypothetical protein
VGLISDDRKEMERDLKRKEQEAQAAKLQRVFFPFYSFFFLNLSPISLKYGIMDNYTFVFRP